MYDRPQSPLSIGGVLDDGFQLAKACFKGVFPIALIGAVFSQIPSFMVGDGSPEAVMSPGLWIAFLVSSVISLFVFIAAVRSIGATAAGEEMSIGEALSGSAGLFLVTLACGIVYGLIVGLGMLLLLVPGILFMLSLGFAPYLVIIDRAGPMEALGISHRLVWGNWWRTAVILSVVLFVTIAAYVVLGVVAGVAAFGSETGSAAFTVIEFVVTVAITAVLTPIVYAFSIAVLNDLKLRSEGGDLEARIDAIGSE